MRILITGGLGFVGGRVALHLERAGHQIVLGSRKADSPPVWLSRAEVVQINWGDVRALDRSCSGVDAVIQAAGMNAQDCAADPVAALEFNGLATARLLAAAVRAKVQRFIYLSTAHVYANPLVGTITEDTCPRNLHPYATSHLAGEHAVLSARQCGQIYGIVLRLSNAFGAPMQKEVNCWKLLVNDLCRQAVQSGQMVLQSSGLQQRDFIAMAQVCSIINYLITLDFETSVPSVINIGSGTSRTVLEMAQLIQRRCRLVLNFFPELKQPEADPEEHLKELKYYSGIFDKIGFYERFDDRIEIDKLLTFCRSSFNK